MTTWTSVIDALQRSKQGDPASTAELERELQAVLQRIALERLDAGPRRGVALTSFVHEAYLRLVAREELDPELRAHFYATATRIVRRMLVDRARRRIALDHDRDPGRVDLHADIHEVARVEDELLLGIEAGLVELERLDERQARVVELRYFGGLDWERLADLVGVSIDYVEQDWAVARAWLFRRVLTA